MAEFSEQAREASKATREANSRKRASLAKKLGVKIAALYPSNLANTAEDSPIRAAALKAGLPIGEKSRKEVTSLPLLDFPEPVRRLVRPHNPAQEQLATIAGLIVEVAKQLHLQKGK